MRMSSRQFPHPVLSPVSDDVDGTFQAQRALARKRHDGSIEVRLSLQLSSRGLQSLVESGQAVLGVHAECGRTRFRQFFRSDSGTQRESGQGASAHEICALLPPRSVLGLVELTPVILAEQDMPAYRLEGEFHPDYGTLAFRVRKGDFLAWHDTYCLYTEALGPERPLTSVISVRPDINPFAPPIGVSTEENSVVITLKEEAYRLFTELRMDPALKDLVSAAVTLPALVAVLQLLREGREDRVADETRWGLALERRLRALGRAGWEWLEKREPLELAAAAAEVLGIRLEDILDKAKKYAFSPAGDEE